MDKRRKALQLLGGAWASMRAAWRVGPNRRRECLAISWALVQADVDLAEAMLERKLTTAELLVASGAVS